VSLRPAHQVATAIIRREDEVVLVLQGAPGEEPFWALPGGVVERDELIPEGLAREVLEETGLTIHLPARLAYIRQIDNRQPARLTGPRGTGEGYVVTVWLFDVDTWDGEIGAQDPDGVVHEARFVPVGEAVERLRRTYWLELAADYLEGRIKTGSLRFERWHEDGRVETIGNLTA
jgi:8-oxo-dGTP diphosphatase